MEECEAICTRLAIMVNGQLKCLGSLQHLKHKFGSAYSLVLKLKPSDDMYDILEETNAVEDYTHNYFPGSKLQDEQVGYIHYQISSSITWADIFGKIERC